MMETVDPGNEYAVPYFWGINTLAINKQQVQKALGTDKLPENEWDLVFNPEYTQKLKSCGISWAKIRTAKTLRTSKPPSI